MQSFVPFQMTSRQVKQESDMGDVDAIKEQASVFRKAIERCARSGRLRAITLHNFPHGSCGDVADMLGMYLNETLALNTEYVAGWHASRSHAWLEHAGIVIDITSDQFGNEPVLVAEESSWHQQFDIDTHRRPGVEWAEGDHRADLMHDYDLVLSSIRSEVN